VTRPGAGHVVVRADWADRDVLSQLVADAFKNLAPSRWLITDPDARDRVFPGYFRICLEHALAPRCWTPATTTSTATACPPIWKPPAREPAACTGATATSSSPVARFIFPTAGRQCGPCGASPALAGGDRRCERFASARSRSRPVCSATVGSGSPALLRPVLLEERSESAQQPARMEPEAPSSGHVGGCGCCQPAGDDQRPC
jgi:hypothetical protein